MNGRRLTLSQLNWLDGYKPRCVECHISCDPRSREYRGMNLCPICYLDHPLDLHTKHKELLCKPR